jgi:hypothetical protein
MPRSVLTAGLRSVRRNASTETILDAIRQAAPGAPDQATKLPAALEVDYIRVYERAR